MVDTSSNSSAMASLPPPRTPSSTTSSTIASVAAEPAASVSAAMARRTRVRALVLAAAKARAQQALTLGDGSATPLFAPFSPSPLRIVHAVWDYLDARAADDSSGDVTSAVAPHELIVDLGCGDARWLIAGVQRYGCEALGVEIDAALVATAQHRVAQLALGDRICICQDDVLRVDISRAALVIVYAFAESLSGIRLHLETQLTRSARVLSIGFRVPAWKPTWSDRVDGLRWYLYDMRNCAATN